MKFKFAVAALALAVSLALPSMAAIPRGDTYPVSDILGDRKLAGRLPADIRFYFGDQPARVVSNLGDVSTLRKSGPKTSRKKPDPKGCARAMASAMIALGEQARAKGGNAVVGITTLYKGEVTASATTYRCERGMQMVSVQMVGQAAIVE